MDFRITLLLIIGKYFIEAFIPIDSFYTGALRMAYGHVTVDRD